MLANTEKTEITKEMTTVGLKAVFEILRKWECSTQQQITILGISKSSYYKYRRAPNEAHLNYTQIERLSYIVNIHASLRALFENPDNVYRFMRMPNKNKPFKGQTPLIYISDGALNSLKDTVQHLAAIQITPY